MTHRELLDSQRLWLSYQLHCLQNIHKSRRQNSLLLATHRKAVNKKKFGIGVTISVLTLIQNNLIHFY